jgi:hypothetical protein
MKRTSILLISAAAIAAIISGVAVVTHLRLSAVEGNEENSNESPQQVINEILTGQPSHSEVDENGNGANVVNASSSTNETEAKESHSESKESPEERAKELD